MRLIDTILEWRHWHRQQRIFEFQGSDWPRRVTWYVRGGGGGGYRVDPATLHSRANWIEHGAQPTPTFQPSDQRWLHVPDGSSRPQRQDARNGHCSGAEKLKWFLSRTVPLPSPIRTPPIPSWLFERAPIVTGGMGKKSSAWRPNSPQRTVKQLNPPPPTADCSCVPIIVPSPYPPVSAPVFAPVSAPGLYGSARDR